MSGTPLALWAVLAAAAPVAATPSAFVATGTGGFLTPTRSAPAAAAEGASTRKGLGVPQAADVPLEVTLSTADRSGQAAIAALLCGFVASAAAVRRGGTRRAVQCRTGLRVTTLDAPSSNALSTTADQLASRGRLDDVEESIAHIVPKISALKNQAELLRSGELKHVLGTMKELRKTELRGVFSEVDQLLCALVDAIDGLRDSAQHIRKSELRQVFHQMDRDAQAWVGKVEKNAVESLTGYRSASQQGLDTMMEVHVVGLSHHKAPVDVREKLAVKEADWNRYAQELVEFARTENGYVVPEVAVLSTCNRFELYFASPELKRLSAVECVHAFLRKKSGLSRDELEPYLFTHTGEEAINHLFEVSSGLDSLVLGEAQILAQVKACHEHSIEKVEAGATEAQASAGSGGKIISKMLNAAIRMGKVARTKTKIGKGSVSVSSAAVELMLSKTLPDLKKYASNVHICILGAGKMSRLLLLALFSKNPDAYVTVVNRSVEKAQLMLEEDMVRGRGGKNAKVVPLSEMMDVVARSDVVFAATASEEPIITAKALQGREKGVMLVDISVPRNVGADCGEVAAVHSYSVDDLKKVVQANADKRQSEVLKAKKLISGEVEKFKLWQCSQGAVPYLAALQSMAENIRKRETKKMSIKLAGLHETEREAVDKLTRHIVDQLFRPIYYSMKENEDIEAKRSKILGLKNIFQLEPEYKRGMLPSGDAPLTHQLAA